MFKLSRLYSHKKKKLIYLAGNYLKLAVKIKDQITDEVSLKSIYLKKMYPSTNNSLLQILYSDPTFYKEMLANDFVLDIVNELWVYKYYYTYNIFLTSTSFKNLRGNLIFSDPQTNNDFFSFRSNKIHDSFNLSSNSNLNYSLNNLNQEESDAMKLKKMRLLDLCNPFYFIEITNNYDYRLTNHIFSFNFWANSPAYKVFIEALIYAIFFIVIFQNLYQIFRIRRIFESFPSQILILIDGFVGLLYGYPVTNELLMSMKPWMEANNVTDPKIAFYYASKQTTRCGVMLMFVPEFKPQCTLYEYAANNIWSLSDFFFMCQYFFYFTFLGSVLEFVYCVIVTKKIKITLKMILDLIITIANIFVQYTYYTKVYNHHAIIRDNILPSYNEIEKTMLFFSFLMWIKFFVYLKLTKSFGYLIKIIEIMIKELIYFLIIFAITILAFSILAADLFQDSNQKFVDFEISVRSFLQITYGEVFFDGFSSNETLGSIMIVIFSVITIVILLNLLVAILSNSYFIISQRSNVENASILYENYLIRKPDKFYSSLIALPPPLNGLTVIFVPFLIIFKSSLLNKILLMLGYSTYFLVYTSLYFIINVLILIPLCWVKYVLFIFLNVVIPARNVRSIMFLLLWMVFGLIKLFYLFFTNDLIHFFKSSFYSSSNRDSLDEITLKEISLIKEKATILLEKMEYISHRDFCEILKEDLETLNQNLFTENDNALSFFNFSEENFSKKFLLSKIFHDYTSQIFPEKINLRKRKKLHKELDIDKMQVFSFLKQFQGVDGNIMLKKLLGTIQILKFCKKFTMHKLNLKQERKLVSKIQIVDMSGVEKIVLGLIAQTLEAKEFLEEFSFKKKNDIF